METRHIGRMVTGSLVGGLVVALGLILGPVAGAPENVITDTILLTFASSWALVGTLSVPADPTDPLPPRGTPGQMGAYRITIRTPLCPKTSGTVRGPLALPLT